MRPIAGGLIPEGACLKAVPAECQGEGWQPPAAGDDELHASAPRDGGAGAGSASGQIAAARSDLHASARPEAAEEGSSCSGAESATRVGGSPDGLHASARDGTVTAAAILEALARDEALTPLPARMTDIKLRLEPAVSRLFDEKVWALRASIRADLQARSSPGRLSSDV